MVLLGNRESNHVMFPHVCTWTHAADGFCKKKIYRPFVLNHVWYYRKCRKFTTIQTQLPQSVIDTSLLCELQSVQISLDVALQFPAVMPHYHKPPTPTPTPPPSGKFLLYLWSHSADTICLGSLLMPGKMTSQIPLLRCQITARGPHKGENTKSHSANTVSGDARRLFFPRERIAAVQISGLVQRTAGKKETEKYFISPVEWANAKEASKLRPCRSRMRGAPL